MYTRFRVTTHPRGHRKRYVRFDREREELEVSGLTLWRLGLIPSIRFCNRVYNIDEVRGVHYAPVQGFGHAWGFSKYAIRLPGGIVYFPERWTNSMSLVQGLNQTLEARCPDSVLRNQRAEAFYNFAAPLLFVAVLAVILYFVAMIVF